MKTFWFACVRYAGALGLFVTLTAADTPPVETLRQVERAVGKALEKARALREFEFSESGDMTESFDDALKSQKMMADMKALADETWVMIEAAGAKHVPAAQGRDAVVRDLGRLLRSQRSRDAFIELEELSGTIARIDDPGLGEKMGFRILERAEMIAQAASFMSPTMRLELAAEMMPLVNVATSFAPDSVDLADEAADLAPQIAQAEAQIILGAKEEIVENQWPGGDEASAIAKAGMAHLKQHGEWGGDKKTPTEILKVATHGEWFVARENILGQPLAYAHPAWIAVREVSSPEGVVNIINISLVTKTPEKNLDFGPVSVSPGIKQMLQSNLP